MGYSQMKSIKNTQGRTETGKPLSRLKKIPRSNGQQLKVGGPYMLLKKSQDSARMLLAQGLVSDFAGKSTRKLDLCQSTDCWLRAMQQYLLSKIASAVRKIVRSQYAGIDIVHYARSACRMARTSSASPLPCDRMDFRNPERSGKAPPACVARIGTMRATSRPRLVIVTVPPCCTSSMSVLIFCLAIRMLTLAKMAPP